MKTVVIYINGIMTMPSDTRDWNYRAVVWTQIKSEYRAQAVEYFCGPIGRAFGQRKRAAKIVELIQAYDGWDIILVGHSNGCDVILTALNSTLTYPVIKEIHLVSAACSADFKDNGLNEALEDGRIGKVFVYIGTSDKALYVASFWIGKLLGYGTLGMTGAKNLSDGAKDKYGELRWGGYGHSTCWEPQHFDRTMRHFIPV